VPPFGSGDFVRLPKKGSQDFLLPTLCFHIFRVSDKSIGLFLRYAFTSRYKEVLSKSHSSSMMTVPKFVPRLTKEETRVFESARESMAAFKKWRAGGVRLQKASILGRKRKTKLPDGTSTP
jgi:GINS complex subunit 3